MVSWVPPGITRRKKRHFGLTRKNADDICQIYHIHLHASYPFTQPMPGLMPVHGLVRGEVWPFTAWMAPRQGALATDLPAPAG